ncbi:MAG: hypothetical protein JRF33_25275 [Deltaproteobacteria bacterium]|nr:hypothetical protein [Deltaproteobacteria bacterium]
MIQDPSPQVVRMIKEYNQGLDVVANPEWKEGDRPVLRYRVVQPVLFARSIYESSEDIPEYGDDDIFLLRREPFSVLHCGPKADLTDRRWTEELDMGKIENARKLPEQMRKRDQAHTTKMEQAVEDESDELYWAFKKDFGDVRLPNVKASDPYDATKKLQDKLGRELR